MSIGAIDFDAPVERRGTGAEKWDSMESAFGMSSENALPMWVADTDFRAPSSVQQALGRLLEHGVYGYHGPEAHYRQAIASWMRSRHAWQVDPDWILSANGLVNGFGLIVDTFSRPSEGVILFTPVYHAFARVITAAERTITECPLVIENGRYRMDFADASSRLLGNERILVLCSPHNPGGTVWRRDELEAVVDFARAHDLLIVSDEIHHDLVYPGSCHTPMARVAGALGRLVMMTAATKTFNIAGCHCGQLIVPNGDLRSRIARRMRALGISADTFGVEMTTAAYSDNGAAWLDAMISYLDGNRRIFDDGIAAIRGAWSMPLEATYLSWVDFSETRLSSAEIRDKIERLGKIAASPGTNFGAGGDTWARFNFGLRRDLVVEAVERLQSAFSEEPR